MKTRFLPLIPVLGAMLLLASCSPVTRADIDLRNQELDKLEQRDQEIRAQLLQRITELRKKLETMIVDVEESLHRRIEDGGHAILVRLQKETAALSSRINAGFDSIRAYMNSKTATCLQDMDKAFNSLTSTRKKIQSKITAAHAEGNRDLEKLLKQYESDVARVLSNGQRAQASIQSLEASIAKAEQLRTLVDGEILQKLDEEYGKMEESQLKLMEAVRERTSDVSSLQVIEDDHLRDLLLQAELLLFDMEQNRDAVESLLGDSENVVSKLTDLTFFIESDILDGAGQAVEDAYDAYSAVADLADFFDSFDISEYTGMISDAMDRAGVHYDEARGAGANLVGELETATDWINENIGEFYNRYDEVHSDYEAAMDLYYEIQSARW